MIELARHIEILLLENDCVILPGFGGFIAHYQPAQYDDKDGIFYPPARIVGFNPQLTMNDGMLVQSYMQAYHTDFSDALRMISEKIELLKETLYKEGVFEICGIGHLYYTIYNTYEFQSDIKGVVSPVLYALDSFSMKPLSVEVISQESIVERQSNSPRLLSKEKKEIKLIPYWWPNVVAVAVSAVLFFTLSYPVENTYIDKGNYASLGTDCLFETIRSQSMATTLIPIEKDEHQKKNKLLSEPIAVKVEKIVPFTEANQREKEIEKKVQLKKEIESKDNKFECVQEKQKDLSQEKKVDSQVNNKSFHIIVSSLTSDSDAQRMIREYQNKGYKNASVIQSNGRFRISLFCFADKLMAYQRLNELKQMDAFKNAWMLTSK